MLEVISLRNDDIIIPAVFLDRGLNLRRVADRTNDFFHGLAIDFLDYDLLPALSQDAAHFFLIENAGVGVARFKIGLITANDVVAGVWEFLAAILNAGI